MSYTNAFDETMGYEGGYAFDPDDRGGETYKGISRKHNPHWEGWKIIDIYKGQSMAFRDGYDILYRDKGLNKKVMDFYESEYWTKPHFDAVDIIWETLAEKMFDTGVNVGTGRVAKWLQSTLNLLNRNDKYYRDITVDGGIGPKTLKTLEAAMGCNPKDRILTVLVLHQGEHYKSIMERDKTQEKYVGWFDRLTYK
jgi:lysozyme family protein